MMIGKRAERGKTMKLRTLCLATPLILCLMTVTTVFAGGQEGSIDLSSKLENSEDNVKIVSVSPGTEKELVAGTSVTFEVGVEYNLVSADSATISLVVQRSEAGKMPLADEIDVIRKGKGNLTISTEVKIPQTKAIQIFTPLLVQGSTETTIVDSRVYTVTQ